jgi:hypothetical protein
MVSKGQVAGKRGRSNRRRGIAAELEVCRLINGVVPGVQAKRHLAQWREKSQQDVEGVAGWMVQVKYCKSLSVPSWWSALVGGAKAQGLEPVLFYRRPGEPWKILVLADSASIAPFETSLDVWAELVIAGRRLGERPWAASDVLG